MKVVIQHDMMDCGPACLSMISSHYGKNISLQEIREYSFITKEGVSLLGIIEASSKIGFDNYPAKITLDKLVESKNALPCILHWDQKHFVVLKKITKNILSNKYIFHLNDPGHGAITLNQSEFCKSWISHNNEGVVLFLSPNEEFNNYQERKQKSNFTYLINHTKPFIKQLSIMFLLLFLSSALTIVFPLLTEKLIDKGVINKDLNIITYILIAQLSLFIGSSVIEIIRNWLMLYVGTKISIEIISEFLSKILLLPIRFFETKRVGDFNQRIGDNERIENFLMSHSLTTFFSLITFSVFFGVLLYYNHIILITYLLLTALSVYWSYFWLRKRGILDYFKFQRRSDNQQAIFEIINGATEMKLNQCQDIKRKEWVNIQNELFKVNIKILKIDQIQFTGYDLINHLKNILVTYLTARFVVNGEMTIGVLISISYIIGQMNSPINQLVSFFNSLQEARLSYDRLKEIENLEPEENSNLKKINIPLENNVLALKNEIEIKNVFFQYEGPKSPYILEDVNFKIPGNKITAIVGSSGSGKTTLLKLLLRFYNPTEGEILFNGENILNLSPNNIRENCGVVMQDGYIFSDSIEKNIAASDEIIDYDKLYKAIKIANLVEFINGLPLGLKTNIGSTGNGISGGQKQRILIARAVYKNPHYIFFDEATSALDAENEKIIHDNLQTFFKGKTVLIIAHRLSTVKNADQIIVLKNGKISEIGSHSELVNKKAAYFNLIRNQLELGS